MKYPQMLQKIMSQDNLLVSSVSLSTIQNKCPTMLQKVLMTIALYNKVRWLQKKRNIPSANTR